MSHNPGKSVLPDQVKALAERWGLTVAFGQAMSPGVITAEELRGRSADLIIMDDPMEPAPAGARETVHWWFQDDKTAADCKLRFDNPIPFRGFPAAREEDEHTRI